MESPRDFFGHPLGYQAINHLNNHPPSTQLGLSEEEPAQPQWDADLALFDQAINDFDDNNIIDGDDDNNNIIDGDDNNNNIIGGNDDNNNYQSGTIVSSTIALGDWEDAAPELVIAKLKQIKPEVYERFGLRPFYKSYNSWEKVNSDQRNGCGVVP